MDAAKRESAAANAGLSQGPIPKARASFYLGCVMLGYIAIYLCRKNLSVANPLLREEFKVTKAQIGEVASWSTAAYAFGKVFFGPIIDRFGGRIIFLLALTGVAIFGAAGAFCASLPMLVVVYSGNRLFGAAGWGSMVKQVPQWFSVEKLALPMAWLSLSFVFGGTLGSAFAGFVSDFSGKNWRAIMGVPSLVVVVLIVISAIVLPKDAPRAEHHKNGGKKAGFKWESIFSLFVIPQFWVVCALSMVLNITRETFLNWAPDFFKTEGGQTIFSSAMLSMSFDLAGGFGILFLGWILDRVSTVTRNRLLSVLLVILSGLIYALPSVIHDKVWEAVLVMALVGFVSYGPYSLLAGVFSVEIKGRETVGTVAGFVDSTGYLGAILAGSAFGHILDQGGYMRGFHLLSWVTLSAAVLCFFLRGSRISESSSKTV